MEDKTEQFLMVPYTILQNKELKDSDKMTLSLIYSFHNNNKEVYISNNKLKELGWNIYINLEEGIDDLLK